MFQPVLLRLTLSLAAALLILGLSLEAPAQVRWVKLAPLPKKSEEFSFVTANGKIYLFGGLPEGKNPPPGLVEVYDPASDAWSQKKPMPLPAHHAAVAEYRGKIYMFGGQAQLEPGGPTQIPLDKSWEYDPGTDSWKALAPMPTARTAAAAAEVGGRIYVIGGASVHPGARIVSLEPNVPHRSLTNNEAYDPATNTWQARSPMPTARNHAAASVVDGKIYVIGGRLGSSRVSAGSNTDVVENYDPATDSWGAVGQRMPTARSGMGWATYRGKIYIAGGEIYDAHMFAAIRAVETYDPATNQWSILSPMPTARHGVNVAAVGDRLYVIGGHLQGGPIGGDDANTDVNEALELGSK